MVGSVLRGLSLKPQMNRSYEPAIRLMMAAAVTATVNLVEKEEENVSEALKRVLFGFRRNGERR